MPSWNCISVDRGRADHSRGTVCCLWRCCRSHLPCSLLLLLIAAVLPSNAFLLEQRGIRYVPSSYGAAKNDCHAAVAVIGGGTSGVLAAIEAARSSEQCPVVLLEATGTVLRNLKQNVCHGKVSRDPLQKVPEVLKLGLPRGRKELTGLLTKTWSPRQQQQWLEEQALILETPEQNGATVCIDTSDGGQGKPSTLPVANRLEAMLHNRGFKDKQKQQQEPQQKLLQGRVQVFTKSKVTAVKRQEDGTFQLSVAACGTSHLVSHDPTSPSTLHCKTLVLATGCSFLGYQLAKRSVGHRVVDPKRSGYPLTVDAGEDFQKSPLYELVDSSRTSATLQHVAPHVRISLKVPVNGQKRPRIFKQEGPLTFSLSRRNGRPDAGVVLEGEAIGRLTSFAAEELHALRKATVSAMPQPKQAQARSPQLLVHFCPSIGAVEKVEETLWRHRLQNGKRLVFMDCPLTYREVNYDEYNWETESFAVRETDCIPTAVWASMCSSLGLDESRTTWGNLSPKRVRALADLVVGCPLLLDMQGVVSTSRSVELFGQSGKQQQERQFQLHEFNTVGGVELSDVNFKTMESKVASGLFFCGKMLDATGCPGGYQFLVDFATGMMAGRNAALAAATVEIPSGRSMAGDRIVDGKGG